MLNPCQEITIACRCSRDRLSFSERLLDIGNEVLETQGLLDPTGQPEESIALVNLALRFATMPAGFRFRAVYEGWDRCTLVQEMY